MAKYSHLEKTKGKEKKIMGISLQAVCIVIQAALLAALGVAWALKQLN